MLITHPSCLFFPLSRLLLSLISDLPIDDVAVAFLTLPILLSERYQNVLLSLFYIMRNMYCWRC